MDKQYDPNRLEAHWQSIWDEASIGEPSPNATPFSMMFPPPNVNGSLHMGHGFLITVSDIYIRYQRMKKQSVLCKRIKFLKSLMTTKRGMMFTILLLKRLILFNML